MTSSRNSVSVSRPVSTDLGGAERSAALKVARMASHKVGMNTVLHGQNSLQLVETLTLHKG